QVLVVEPDDSRREEIQRLIDADDVQVVAPIDQREALTMLTKQRPDCVVINPAATTFVEQLADHGENGDGLAQLPVIVYGPPQHGDGEWSRLADSYALRQAGTPDRLLDLIVLFTHRTVRQLADDKRQMLIDLHDSDRILADKRVLIVDDDMRNIFAL